MAVGGTIFAVIAFVGLITLSVVVPLTVDGAPIGKTESGFATQPATSHYLQKLCPTEKNWTLQLVTNERVLSDTYFAQSEDIDDERGLNTLAAFFGQFVDHDLVLSKTNETETYVIPGINLTVTRTIKHPTTGETQTFISTSLDLSTVYGSFRNPDKIAAIRMSNSCYLNTSPGNLLPLLDEDSFIAGDERSDENAVLTSLHTLFMREHNRLCDVLPQFWTEDERFWKARQINIAKYRQIVYKEWLPALFGSQVTLLNSVDTLKTAPHRLNEVFAGSAFRFGHSMINNRVGDHPLLSLFFNISMVQSLGIGHFLEAASQTPAQKVDRFVVDGLRNIMFGSEDLIARNLFRGRDMGLPTYAEICECFGTTPYTGDGVFEDPLLGLLAEPVVAGSSLPRTIAVVVAEQFRRIRADFTPESQLFRQHFFQEITFTTLASLVEKNTNITGPTFFLN